MKNSEFTKKLKIQILDEFNQQDRKGIYAYTQKAMAYNSNKIEGSTLTSEQTASIFDTGTLIVEDNSVVYRTKDIEEMTGHFKMFNEVLKSLGKPLSSSMIKSFHYQLKAGVFEDYANGYPVGEFKNRMNQVSDIKTELPKDVPQKIEELLLEFNNKALDLSDITEFHAKYEKIHPFQDGNGRTGRAILLKQCLENDLIPVIISDDDKAIYYHALHLAQTQEDYSKLKAFFEKEQVMYYENIKEYIFPSEISFSYNQEQEERD